MVGAWEEGRCEPSYQQLINICNAFPKYDDMRKLVTIDIDHWKLETEGEEIDKTDKGDTKYVKAVIKISKIIKSL